MTPNSTAPRHLYVGTFTRGEHGRGEADGIDHFAVGADGALTPAPLAAGVANPSFLAVHPHRPLLYSVNAVPEFEGQPGGSLSALAIDEATGNLTLLNRQPTGGAGPCHVAVEATGRWAFSAAYAGGSVAMFPIQADGSLGPRSDFHQHGGSSVHPERQVSAHAHSLTIDPSNGFALVCDLGLDRVLVYRLDLERGRLLPNDPPGVAAAPGAGPRHLGFHPDGRHVYVINEIDSTVTAYAWDGSAGRLTPLQTLSTLPAGWQGTNSTADIHVSPDGAFVYGSNRGHDSLVIYAVDGANGRLRPVGHVSTGGRTPRNFAFHPNGELLYAANQDSHTIVTFSVNRATGQLAPTGAVAASKSAVCLKFR